MKWMYTHGQIVYKRRRRLTCCTIFSHLREESVSMVTWPLFCSSVIMNGSYTSLLTSYKFRDFVINTPLDTKPTTLCVCSLWDNACVVQSYSHKNLHVFPKQWFFLSVEDKKHHFKVLFTYKELKTPRRTKIPLKRESLLLERSLFCSSRLHLFDQIYSKNCQILLSLKIAVFYVNIIEKAVFSASLLQSSVSHDPSEIIIICWFAAQEIFLIIINVENSCAAQYFCGNCDAFYFSGFTD